MVVMVVVGFPRRLLVRNGLIRRDVEQVPRRHANLYAPAQARIVKHS